MKKFALFCVTASTLILTTFGTPALGSFQFVATDSFQYTTIWLDENFNAAPDADLFVGDGDAITNQNLSVNHPLDVDNKAGSATLNSTFNDAGVSGSATGSAGDPSYEGPDTVMADSVLAVRFEITDAPVVIRLSALGTVTDNNTGFDPIIVGIYQPDLFTPVALLDTTLDLDGTFSDQQAFLIPVGSYAFWAESIIGTDNGNVTTSSLSFVMSAPEPASASLLALPLAMIRRRRR